MDDGKTDAAGTVAHDHMPRPLTIAPLRESVSGTGGGAAGERAARSAARDAKASAGGGVGVRA